MATESNGLSVPKNNERDSCTRESTAAPAVTIMIHRGLHNTSWTRIELTYRASRSDYKLDEVQQCTIPVENSSGTPVNILPHSKICVPTEYQIPTHNWARFEFTVTLLT